MRVRLHPHLTALGALERAIEDQTGAQQVRRGLRGVALSVQQAPLGEPQRRSVPPVVPVRLLDQGPVCVQGRVGAPVPV